MTKFIKKPLSILLTVLMVFSVFAVVPFTASAETYVDNVNVSELAVGDVLTTNSVSDIKYLWFDIAYKVVFKGGTYKNWDGPVESDTEIQTYEYQDFQFSKDTGVSIYMYGGSYDNYFKAIDESGDNSDKWYVLAKDENTITFGGHVPVDYSNGTIYKNGEDLEFADLNAGDYICAGIGSVLDSNSEYTVKLIGKKAGYYYDSELSPIDYTQAFTEGMFDISTKDDGVCFQDWNGGEDYYPCVNGELAEAFFVTKVDHDAKEIKLAGANLPAPTYTVTWKNGDDVIKTDTVDKDTVPAYSGNVPEKAEDANNTYTFSGWTDGTNTYGATDTLPAVIGDITYTATYTATEKSAGVTASETLDLTTHWTKIKNSKRATGFTTDHFSVQPASPSTTVGDTHGWSLDRDYADEVYMTISALNGETITKIDVILDSDGNTPNLKANGNEIAYSRSDNTFTFENVNASDIAIYTNSDYSGSSFCTIKTIVVYYSGGAPTTYTVTWKNGDTTLKTDTVNKDAIPAYSGNVPEKAEDENNTYTFSGWTDGTNTYGATDTLPAVTGDVTYIATFEETPKTPEPAPGNFVKVVSRPTDWSGDYLIVNEGTMSAFDGGLTALNSDDNKVSISDDYVPGNIPTFKSSATTYAARFTIAAVDGGYSIKSASGKFIGNTANSSNMQTSDTALVNTITWNSGKIHVTASGGPELYYDYQNNRFSYYTNDSMYFDSVKLYKFVPSEPVTTYTVTWKNGDTVLETDENVAEGTTPEYNGTTPVKDEDANNTYTFSGWSPEVTAVTGDVTYTAQFTATEKAPATVKTIAAGETYYIGDSIAFSDAPPFVYVRYDDDTSYGPTGAYAYLIGGENTTVTAPTYSTRDGQWKFNDVLRYEPWASARPLRITGTNDRTPIGFKCSGGTGTSSDPFTFECVFEAEEETGINYGDDNYIKQDDKVTVSDSDEGKSKFGLGLNEYLNMQILGVQLKNSIATEGGDDGIRFVTAVNSNLLKGSNIEDYGYIVVKAKAGTSVDKIYENMDKLTYDKVADKNRFSCYESSNTISGEFGQYASDTDYKYVTLSLTGTSGSTDTVAARFYVKTKDGNYYYANYIKGNDTFDGIAFNLADIA